MEIMDITNISDLLSHLNSLSSAYSTHWNFFAVVALGIVTGISLKEKKIEVMVGLLLIVGVIMFLSTNFYRISETIEEIKVVECEIEIQMEKENNLTTEFKNFYTGNRCTGENLRFNSDWQIFHIIIDLFLIIIIIMRILQGKTNNNANRPGQHT